MKRFMLFGYYTHEAGGGSTDVIDSYNTLDEILTYLNAKTGNFWDTVEVLDLENGLWAEIFRIKGVYVLP